MDGVLSRLKERVNGWSPEWAHSPPREEGWLRHQENFGEAYLSAADGVVTRNDEWLVSDHPGRCRGHPSSRG